MEKIRDAGCAVGEYAGNGQGEVENVTENVTQESPSCTDLDFGAVDADLGVEESFEDEIWNENEDDGDDTQPLLIFYDCETTGFSIYSDHITDIAAKVVASPVPVTVPTFSSLVKTSRSIPSAGMATKA